MSGIGVCYRIFADILIEHERDVTIPHEFALQGHQMGQP